MVNTELQPSRTFSSIYGRDLIFVACSSPNASRWLPRGMFIDMATTGLLTVLGDIPIVCAASVSTPDALSLLRDAGFQLPREIHRYVDVADYVKILKKFCAAKLRMVAQHVHPLSEIPREYCWIEPSVLSFVNNKANLEKLVPRGNIPVREIVSVDQFASRNRTWNPPIVIKAVTDESTGGGVDIRICRNSDDIKKAGSFFADCRYVVVEEYLDIRRNLCLHYCVTADGGIDYLGFAEQVSDEQGIYRGNWIEVGDECPAEAVEIGALIVRAAFEMGYYGILGMDMAMQEEGHCKVFDLNFRGNGSASALLYAQSIHQHYQKPVIRLRRLTGRGNYRDLLNAVYLAMAKGILLPLGSCDPEAGPYIRERPLLNGMILGETRQDVLKNESELVSMGLDI